MRAHQPSRSRPGIPDGAELFQSADNADAKADGLLAVFRLCCRMGPHNVRDVLATHILKVTGSYEQASYAIQDTPEMVASHYGRFLPQDKAALAAQILNRVWEAA